jgi:arylsulfatase A-like enzyme
MQGKTVGKQQWWRQLYMSMVNYLDTSIGEVVAALKTKQMWDNTLVVFAGIESLGH